ncbi:MAG: TetR/AcrR family transcriptional regulator [Chloroflexi bacterium]|nr:TetR/AcrR family transcriptional regulator [Chloroflexota bacterium]
MTLKETIIHESMKLFSLNGFINTGISDILEASQTSKGGFYNHFSNKEELFFLVLAEAQKIWRHKVLNGIRNIDSPTEKINQILRNYRDNYLKDSDNFPGGCIFITFSVELDDQRPHLMEKVNEGFEGFKRLLEGLLEEAIEIGEISKDAKVLDLCGLIFIGMLGTSVLYGVDKSSDTLDNSINTLIEYLNTQRL